MTSTSNPNISGPFGANLDAVLAKARGENFPVASRLLPAEMRGHLLAVYGFARLADDIGDEYVGDRLVALDQLEAELDLVFAGRQSLHPVMERLAVSVHEVGLDRQPFADLIEANRIDQRVDRYRTFAELLGYCELSANPVGRLVLQVFGADTPDRRHLSDSVCSGLQVVEHIQDIGEDHARGRIYVPLDDLARAGCPESDLGADQASTPLRQVVRLEVERARGLLAAGDQLVSSLDGRARLAVTGFVAGGRAALDAVERARHDVLGVRCRPTRRRLVGRGLGVWMAARRSVMPAGAP